MDLSNLLRLGAATVMAFAGLFIAARMHFEVSAQQVGLLVMAFGVLYAYREVKAYFDARDHD